MSRRLLVRAALVGVGGTATMDLAGEVLRRIWGVEPLDYRLLGRWIGHMGRGRLAHESIGAADPIAGERAVGWVAHYSIGTGFAVALATVHPGWIARPSLSPALTTGVATTAAPWLIMQPAFGLGVAASRTPKPWLARWRSLRTHAVYGVGLYVWAQVLHRTLPAASRDRSAAGPVSSGPVSRTVSELVRGE